MSFDEVIDRTIELLRRRGRVTYRTIKRQFDLDDDALDDLKHELIKGQRLATDEDGEVLIWAGPKPTPAPPPDVVTGPARVDPPRVPVRPAPARESAPSSVTMRTPSGRGSSPRGSAVRAPAIAPSPSTAHRVSTVVPTPTPLPSSKISPSSPSRSAPHSAPRDSREERAERRQITVMFCDLVGSTALASQLDPEDLRELVRAYQEVCDEQIQQFGGYVAQYLGDGVLAYFGWPTAHEDAAVRAVRAAMGCVAKLKLVSNNVLKSLSAGLSVRVGIHTGVVVVGEVGAGAGMQNLALGEAPNVAARVQGLAEPDTVVLTEMTQKLVAKTIDLHDLGPTDLKGISGKVRLYRVIGENPERVRDDARAMVGREREFSLFREALGGLRRGKGAVLLVSGEAGIGKSRLVQAARDLASDGVTYRSFRCSPYHVDTAFHPFVEHVERRLGLTRDGETTARLQVLREALPAPTSGRENLLPILAQLLGISGEDVPKPGIPPERQKAETLSAIADWVADDAKQKPVLAVWEDMHWADASTIDLVTRLVAEAEHLPILHLLTYRPEFVPRFRSSRSTQEIALTRFGKGEVDTLVGQLLGGKKIAPELLALVAEKTDGVPLFVEEVVRVLLESGDLVERDGAYQPAGSISALSVPSTLHDSLMARLDRMSSAREVAQLAATVGREFSVELLLAIAPLSAEEVHTALDQLVQAEILLSLAGGERYAFKHALIQDVAYQSLLRTTRQRHHENIATALETTFPVVAERQPELVAHHFSAAGLPHLAIPYHRRAGERALAQSAYMEAVAHLSRALDATATLAETPERDRLELDLLLLRGVPLTATRGYGAPEVRESYNRARVLSERFGESTKIFPALYGLWRSCLLRAEYSTGLSVGEELLRIGETSGAPTFLVCARRSQGAILFYMGDFARAAEHMRWVMSAPVPPETVRRESESYEVVDSFVTAHSYLAWTNWMIGEPVRACMESDRAVDIAEDLGNGFTRALSLSFASWLHQFRRDVGATRHRVEQALAISSDKGLEMWVGWNKVLQGWTISEDGKHALAVERIREGIDIWRGTGSDLGMSYYSTLLAEAEGRAGNVSAGLAAIADAERFAARTHERFYASETLRTKAELLHLGGANVDVVASTLLAAIAEANERGASSFAVRAATSLVRRAGKDRLAVLEAELAKLGSDCPERDVTEAQELLQLI